MLAGRRYIFPLFVAVLQLYFGGVGCGNRSTTAATPTPSDTTPPVVTNVTASNANGTLIIGQTVTVQIAFSESVTVTGSPTLTLETGTTDRIATYSAGTGTTTLEFTYTVQNGDTSSDLDYVSTGALTLAGGTIADAASNAATLTLAAPGASTSLSFNKAIGIDGIPPTVLSATSTDADDTYVLSEQVTFDITFDDTVTVTGTPLLTLETGTTDRTASYQSGSGSNTLRFSYTVRANDLSADLDYASSSALSLNGGTINDSNGNAAVRTLPTPGATGSISFSKSIVVDGYVPLISTGGSHTCGTTMAGVIRCWGGGSTGQLGNRSLGTWGNQLNEMGALLPATDLGPGLKAVQISNGSLHTCAVLNTGGLKCWGSNNNGQLGRDSNASYGGGGTHMGNNLSPIDLGVGRTARAVAAGGSHTCAILDDYTVKCWGLNGSGQLGYDSTTNLGDNPGEMAALAVVNLGSHTAVDISAGANHTCVVLDDGGVKCWGSNSSGKLGIGSVANQGDGAGEMAGLGSISLGTGRTALQVGAGTEHTCARLDNGTVKCWGDNLYGQLGIEDQNDRGDGAGEMGDSLAAVNLGTGRTATRIAVGGYHTCAILDNATLKCWGRGNSGQLGQESSLHIGDGAGEMGDPLPAVSLGTGRTALSVSANDTHTCVTLDQGSLKCWGGNASGQLGYEDTTSRGTLPGSMGDSLNYISLQ